MNRFAAKGVGKRQRHSVWITNIEVVVMFGAAVWGLGVWDTCRIAIPIAFVSSAIGVWLFYIQHQFEGVQWFRHEQWDILKASLEGCSYYKLPNVLHWFMGNIGIHHIHHVRTRFRTITCNSALMKRPNCRKSMC